MDATQGLVPLLQLPAELHGLFGRNRLSEPAMNLNQRGVLALQLRTMLVQLGFQLLDPVPGAG